jgi:hypothetical protein
MLPVSPQKDEAVSSIGWWNNGLSLAERAVIEETFRPLGDISADSLVRSADPCSVGTIALHLKRQEVRHLGYKILRYADTLVCETLPVLRLHYYFQLRGEFFYRWRDADTFALGEAIKSFEQQIGMSDHALNEFKRDKSLGIIPAHAGFRQLRIIYEKRGDLTLARALCEKALKDGWADDWNAHILRIDRKLAKIALTK